jgi:hypothetical protein
MGYAGGCIWLLSVFCAVILFIPGVMIRSNNPVN